MGSGNFLKKLIFEMRDVLQGWNMCGEPIIQCKPRVNLRKQDKVPRVNFFEVGCPKGTTHCSSLITLPPKYQFNDHYSLITLLKK